MDDTACAETPTCKPFDRGAPAALAALCLVLGCASQAGGAGGAGSATPEGNGMQEQTIQRDYGAFQLKLEPEVACERVDAVDVNLGHTPEAFVRAAHCQIAGEPAPQELVAEWAEQLREVKHVRRIDVVRQLCVKYRRRCELRYSDPWASQPELVGAPERTLKRDVGAVFMFFFNCPGGVNCGMNWANTHAVGMDEPHPLLGFGSTPDGVYTPNHPGFWRRELLDAKYAGLQFLLLNTYGPDIEDDKLAPLTEALDSIEEPIKIGLFDDTWTWGEPWFSKFWEQKPNLKDTEATAKLLYEAKWKPFFSQVDEKHWYRFKGRPFIYWYNAGKLEPRNHAAPVLARMKEMFEADFGEKPFVSADIAYFDDKRMPEVADSQFKWFTFQTPGNRSRSTLNGHVIDHAMVRWDAVGRERPDQPAKKGDLLVKGSEILEKVLNDSKDAEVLVLATWNDLGEGTGINRNYDYYVDGEWLAPDHFMKIIRNSQSGK